MKRVMAWEGGDEGSGWWGRGLGMKGLTLPVQRFDYPGFSGH